MHCIAARKGRYYFGLLIFVSVWLVSAYFGAQAGAQTAVGATVCQTESMVSLTQPVSDSTVTTATVPLAGSVMQANQIEVYVDDVFDSTIPLAMGQTTYTGAVQIAEGTHTIKVIAVNVCPGPNGSASSVVTYEPPPETAPSTGNETPTETGGEDGVVVSTAGGEITGEGTGGQPFPEQLSIPFQRFLGWLNITTADTTEGQSLSLWRAVVIGGGLYLLVVGVATTAVQMIASIPAVTALLPAPTKVSRVRWLSWGFRGLGLLLVLGGLLL